MTGLSLAQAIRADGSAIPFLIITGHQETIRPDQARAAKILEVLGKALRRSELVLAIERSLDTIGDGE